MRTVQQLHVHKDYRSGTVLLECDDRSHVLAERFQERESATQAAIQYAVMEWGYRIPGLDDRVSGVWRTIACQSMSMVLWQWPAGSTAALAGLGIAFVPEPLVLGHLEAGRLERLLDGWSPAFEGYCLYYPANRNPPTALKLFADTVREWGRVKNVSK